jgi:hypothetical protein
MPYRIECVHCKRVGLVRVERILKGERTYQSYYCGSCNHIWLVVENDEPRRTPSGHAVDGPEPSKS